MTSADTSVALCGIVEWGVASRPFPGESESGDLHVVAPFEGGVLLGVIDGLGHGAEAAHAARRGARVLSDAPSQPVRRLIEHCHVAMRGSRGAVMTIAVLDAKHDRLTWTAIGNVEGALWRAKSDNDPIREAVVPRGGVVGYQLPSVRETVLPIARGDVLILATDGIGHDFVLDSPLKRPAQGHAHDLLDRYGKDSDDALVLVVRYLGRSL